MCTLRRTFRKISISGKNREANKRLVLMAPVEKLWEIKHLQEFDLLRKELVEYKKLLATPKVQLIAG